MHTESDHVLEKMKGWGKLYHSVLWVLPTIYPTKGAVAMFGISASQLVHLILTT